MPRSVLVPNVKQLTDHYLRQQHGGNIVGFRGARIQRGYNIGGIFKSFARIAIPLFKRGAKSRGKQAVSDMAEAATSKVMVGRGRKKGIKRAATGKTVIHAPTKKLKLNI